MGKRAGERTGQRHAALASAGVRAQPRIEADSFTLMLSLVSEGYSTVVGHPWLTDHRLPANVRALPLRDPEVSPWVVLLTATSDPGSPAARALRSALAGVDLQAWIGGV